MKKHVNLSLDTYILERAHKKGVNNISSFVELALIRFIDEKPVKKWFCLKCNTILTPEGAKQCQCVEMAVYSKEVYE